MPDGADPPPDPYGQAQRCLEIILASLAELGAAPEHVVRTRVYLKRAEDWPEARIWQALQTRFLSVLEAYREKLPAASAPEAAAEESAPEPDPEAVPEPEAAPEAEAAEPEAEATAETAPEAEEQPSNESEPKADASGEGEGKE